MTAAAVCYAFSVEPGLEPKVGAAPYEVLARQIPRMVVLHLNGDADRGLRFFPFLGPVEGQRRFLELPDLLPTDRLLELHGQSEGVEVLVDGCIQADGLRLRLIDGQHGQVRFEECLPFDPADPVSATRRILFELTGALGWAGAMPELPTLPTLAWSHLLVARDDLLALEAGIERDDSSSWVRSVREAMRLVPHEPAVQEILVQIAVRLLRNESYPKELVEALLEAWPDQTSEFQTTLARIMDGLATRLFSLGRYDHARLILEEATKNPTCREAVTLMRLAVASQRTGHRDRQNELLEEICEFEELPSGVLRVLAVELAERGRHDEALARLAGTLAQHPEEAALWLEQGRIQLRLSRMEAGRSSLETCLQSRPNSVVAGEARRLLRLSRQPDTFQAMLDLDDALQKGELLHALTLARRVARRQRTAADAWMFVGVIRHRLGHRRRARRALLRAVKLDPELGEAHNRLGILLVELGRAKEGYEHLLEAARLMPDDPSPQIHLAQACCYLERREEGEQALATAERLGADNELLASVRGRFFE